MTYSNEAIDLYHRFDDEKVMPEKECDKCGYMYLLEDLDDFDLCYDCSQIGDE